MAASTLSSWALLAWDELVSRDINANDIFKKCSLDTAKLSNSSARYPVEKMRALWQCAVEASGDEGFAVAAGQRWNPTTFHALGFAWLASSTLGEAINRFSRYGRLLNDGLSYELTSNQLLYQFRISINDTDTQHAYHPGSDAGIAAFLKMARMLLGESFSPVEITCPHEPNGASLPLETLARCPVHYGKGYMEYVIDRHDIERKLSSGNEELTQAHEKIILKHLANLDQEQLSTQVKLKILEQLPSGNVKEGDIASELGLSSRTMQRRLLDEGLNFSGLLQKTRQQLATQYIKDDNLAISEIAYLLGFSDQANFTRAFKRWNGVSPTQFRTQEMALN